MTLAEDNGSTNHDQNTEMQTLSQWERVTLAKTKTLPPEETSKSISQSATEESLLHAESNFDSRKTYDPANFISKISWWCGKT